MTRTWLRESVVAALGLSLLIGTVGCSLIRINGKTWDEYQAEQNGQSASSGAGRESGGGTDSGGSGDRQTGANCIQVKGGAARGGDQCVGDAGPNETKQIEAILAKDCSEFMKESNYLFEFKYIKEDAQEDFEKKFLKKGYECKDDKFFFELGIKRGWSARGDFRENKNLSMFPTKELRSRLGAYLKSNNIECGKGCFDVMYFWLEANGSTADCPDLRKALPKVSDYGQSTFLGYFENKGCKTDAIAVATDFLQSPEPGMRITGCETLGRVGTTASVRKMKALADRDAYSVVRKRVQVYPVRDACNGAIAQLELRH